MRLFIGIKVDSKTQKKINSYFNFFYENKVTGNYSKISNLHMTLVFLGETDEGKIPLIKDIIKNVSFNIDEIIITKFAMLKDILVGEVKNNQEIQDMYNKLKQGLKKNGIIVDSNSLYPHVTLIRKAVNCGKFVGKEVNLTSKFDHITLFESRRINGELVYIDLGE